MIQAITNEGEIIPLDLDVPEPNEDSADEITVPKAHEDNDTELELIEGPQVEIDTEYDGNN